MGTISNEHRTGSPVVIELMDILDTCAAVHGQSRETIDAERQRVSLLTSGDSTVLVIFDLIVDHLNHGLSLDTIAAVIREAVRGRSIPAAPAAQQRD